MKRADNFGASSFHGTVITTTASKLIAVANKFNAPYCNSNSGEDKTNFDFDFETEDGTYFTVYDWKEYRPIGLNEIVVFHIGAKTKSDGEKAYDELVKELNNL